MIVFLGLVFFVKIQTVLPARIHGPSNVAVVVGKSVSMSCRPNSAKNYVTWYYIPVDGEDKSSQVRPINNGHVPNRNFSEFSFGGTAPGEVLILNKTHLRHAGLYRCTTEGQKATAQLIVLASEPNCSFTFDQRLLHLSCIVKYNGNWIPFMQWIEMAINGTESRIISDNNCSKTSNNIETLNHIVAFAIESIYVFKLNFAHISCSKNNSTATNIPDYEYTWKLTSDEIFYGPYNVTVNPKKDEYTSGDHLNCSSVSNPVPKFKWKEENVGDIHLGPILSLRNFSSRKEPYIIQCLAVNLMTNMSASSDLHKVHIANQMPNKNVPEPADETKTEIKVMPTALIIVLIVVPLALTVLIVLVVCGVSARKRKSKTTKQTTTDTERMNCTNVNADVPELAEAPTLPVVTTIGEDETSEAVYGSYEDIDLTMKAQDAMHRMEIRDNNTFNGGSPGRASDSSPDSNSSRKRSRYEGLLERSPMVKRIYLQLTKHRMEQETQTTDSSASSVGTMQESPVYVNSLLATMAK